MLDDGAPLFAQIADTLANQIADGTLGEGDRAPSSNELSAYYRINPATAVKGINVLVDQGLLTKVRGIGMFVAVGARQQLLQQRRAHFVTDYVEPLLQEASRLAMTSEEVLALVRQAIQSQGGGEE